eukprot:15413116-Alexandrium_andersonii.AAC.1
MSASLVGSEMCIRDRSLLIILMGRPLDRKVGHTHDGHGYNAGMSDSASAVSYTHLTLPTICSV